jgi:uncharacterized protein YndB with AHSA1/START domain
VRIDQVTGSQIEVRKRSSATLGNKITKKVWIKASKETVYDALTDCKQLAQWFCDRASCDVNEEKELIAHWKTGKIMQQGRAVFTRVVPQSALELLWVDDGNGEQENNSGHTLSYEIRSKSGMTELIMIDQDDAVPDEEAREVLDQGWNSVLMELKDFCERKERVAKPRQASQRLAQKTPRD